MNKRLVTFCMAMFMAATLCFGVRAAEDGISIDRPDGEYEISVSMEGGSGRASIDSPATLIVKDGKASVRIVWSSPNYDYMIVGQERYEPVNEEGNSEFEIPIPAFDEPVTVIADTTAMSVPHEIQYTLTFDSGSIVDDSENPGWIWGIGVVLLIAVIGVGVRVCLCKKKDKE